MQHVGNDGAVLAAEVGVHFLRDVEGTVPHYVIAKARARARAQRPGWRTIEYDSFLIKKARGEEGYWTHLFDHVWAGCAADCYVCY